MRVLSILSKVVVEYGHERSQLQTQWQQVFLQRQVLGAVPENRQGEGSRQRIQTQVQSRTSGGEKGEVGNWMNRILFDASELDANQIATVGDERAEHIRTVLHGTVGQPLKTGTVNGLIGTGVILDVSSTTVAVQCRHAEESIRPWIDLILAPPRPRVMKRLLPQLATLGVGRIVLVGAEKVEKAFWGAQLLKEEIYRPLLVEGLQQAGTSILPTIQQEKSFRYWMRRRMEEDFAGQTLRIVAHPYGVSSASDVAAQSPTSRPVLAVGPEGGWTEEEVQLLEEHGFLRFSLGARILRTDTALIALLARLMPHFDK